MNIVTLLLQYYVEQNTKTELGDTNRNSFDNNDTVLLYLKMLSAVTPATLLRRETHNYKSIGIGVTSIACLYPSSTSSHTTVHRAPVPGSGEQ
jgi:hypothetical protein